MIYEYFILLLTMVHSVPYGEEDAAGGGRMLGDVLLPSPRYFSFKY
jgi:hypothetical protein